MHKTILVASISSAFLVQQAASAADTVRVDPRTNLAGNRAGTGPTDRGRVDNNRTSSSTSTSSSKVRSSDEVRSSRSAHAHTRIDHTANRATAMGLSKPTTGQERVSIAASSDKNAGQVQNLIVTEGSDSDDGSNSSGTQQSGNQGIGDGSGVSVNSPTSISELNSQVRTLTLREGTAFIAHPRPIRIETNNGSVLIAPRSAVYIVSSGKSVAIHNLADHKANDVRIKLPSNKTITVKAGEQLLLTDKNNQDFDKANPVPEIKASRTKELGTELDTKIFNSEVSPLSVLDRAEGFHDLLRSNSKQDQALAKHILKMAAIVLSLRPTNQ